MKELGPDLPDGEPDSAAGAGKSTLLEILMVARIVLRQSLPQRPNVSDNSTAFKN